MKTTTTKTKKALQRRIDELTAQIEQVHAELRIRRSSNRRGQAWRRRYVLQARAGELGDQMRQAYDEMLAR